MNESDELLNKDEEEILDYSALDIVRELELENKIDLTQLDEFQDGLTKALYYAGFYTGLRNYGISTEDAYTLTLNEHTCNHNLEIAKIQSKDGDEYGTNVIGFQIPDSNEEYEDEE
jgi:hypothetical protein